MRAGERPRVNFTVRVYVALAFIVLVFCLLALRLWYLQIVQGDYFRERSENNLYRTVFVPPPRGLILDRYGRILVRNRPSFNVELSTVDAKDPKASVKELAKILGVSETQLFERLRDQKTRPRFEPKLLLKDAPRDFIARTLAHQYMLPGVNVQVVPAREYVYGALGAHVIGYLGQITKTQLEQPDYAEYRLGDVVGQYGVELRWEQALQGRRGIRRVTVNANGIRIGESKYEPEQQGHNLTLTLSLKVQEAAEKAFAGVRGGVVAIDPRTGEVLALASTPAFDPNDFVSGISPALWKDLMTGKDRKLHNRVVQGAYPAGSTFKVLMAAAGLQEGVITPNGKINCPGSYWFAGRSYHCHKKEGHGGMDLVHAVQKSCNVYFYNVGQRLGIERMADYGARFGLGKPSGIGLVHENPGTLPSPEWKRRHYRKPEMQKWFAGETLSVAIGQGAVAITPLQLAMAVSALVNGGTLYSPILVKRIESQDGQYRDDAFAAEVRGTLRISPDALKTVIAAMETVVEEPGGTGSKARLDLPEKIRVGGKTGTAQVAGLEAGRNVEGLEDHAWFVGFAPVEAPEIVVAAIVENGGHGGAATAPRVKEVMEAYFRETRGYPDPTPTPEATPTPVPKSHRPR